MRPSIITAPPMLAVVYSAWRSRRDRKAMARSPDSNPEQAPRVNVPSESNPY